MSPAHVTDAGDASTGRGRELPRMFKRWWSPVWVAFIASQWWFAIHRQLAGVVGSEELQVHANIAATMGAAGHLAGNAIEALFYMGWWRLQGVRLGFARLFEALVSISAFDLLALGLTHLAQTSPGWAAHVIESFVGFGVLEAAPESGSWFRVAFGSTGLLCVARLLATAAVQRQGTQRSLGAPLVLTIVVWLLGRLASGWMADLARGVSPMF